MSLDKFSGKSKDDLILIATIGQVMTQEMAVNMTREELIQRLNDAEEQSKKSAVSNSNKVDFRPASRPGRPSKKSIEERTIISPASDDRPVSVFQNVKSRTINIATPKKKPVGVSRLEQLTVTELPKEPLVEQTTHNKSLIKKSKKVLIDQSPTDPEVTVQVKTEPTSESIIPNEKIKKSVGRHQKSKQTGDIQQLIETSASDPKTENKKTESTETVKATQLIPKATIAKKDKVKEPTKKSTTTKKDKETKDAKLAKAPNKTSVDKSTKTITKTTNQITPDRFPISPEIPSQVELAEKISNVQVPEPELQLASSISVKPANTIKGKPGRKPQIKKEIEKEESESSVLLVVTEVPEVIPLTDVEIQQAKDDDEQRYAENAELKAAEYAEQQITKRGRRPKFHVGATSPGEHLKVSTKHLPNGVREHISDGDKHLKPKHSAVDINTNSKRTNTTESGVPVQSSEELKKIKSTHIEITETIAGVLEVMSDGYGFLRKENYLQSPRDIYIAPQYIRRFNLRTGDMITGPCKPQKDTDRYQALLYIKDVNGYPPEKMIKRPSFDRLTPIYPEERFILETTRNELSTRIIDLIAPIGRGQRGVIVSPPKAGKTILLQKIANAIAVNNPSTKLIVLLIDERPEEVTDMQRSIKGEVVYSTFDKTPENHVKIVELVLERAMRLVELGEDVVILLDSITRLGRAYNLTIQPTGRTLSGGLDPGALYGPKRFFGAARNIENGGSLTIIATSLIDTGSRMDEVIFEEFKGTGNMEVYLDRKLSEKRIFPAIDINRSGTRREELLLSQKELDAVWTIRKAFGQLDTAAVTEMIINLLLKTANNPQFVSSVNVSMNDKTLFESMRGNKPINNNGNGPNGYH